VSGSLRAGLPSRKNGTPRLGAAALTYVCTDMTLTADADHTNAHYKCARTLATGDGLVRKHVPALSKGNRPLKFAPHNRIKVARPILLTAK
jgi:hypothetical protein